MTRKNALSLPILLALIGPIWGCDRSGSAPPANHAGTAASGSEDRRTDRDGHGHAEAGGEEGHADEVRFSPEAFQQAGIRVEPAKKQALVDTINAPARVAFNAEAIAHVGSPLSGRVSDIKVRVGDWVNKGDPLLVVQSPDLGEAQSDFLLRRMAVDTATPVVDLAKAVYDRAKALYEESQGIALTEVQKREAEYKAAQGALLAAKAQATAAENRLHLLGMGQAAVEALSQTGEIDPHYTVRAPINGQVIDREATLGELVNPDREALLVLADTSTLWVLADVPESRLSHVRKGAKTQVVVPALRDQSLEGVVTFIAPSLDPTTRTVSVRVEVKSNGHDLRPGMFAQAVISEAGDGDGHEPVVAIPEEATQLVEGQTVVFVPVAGEENTFTKRPVKLGPVIGRMVPVLSGLKEGELFVSTGSFILKAEMGKAGAEHEH